MIICFSVSLRQSPCTFESDHRSCLFSVVTDGQTCRSDYSWRRGGGYLDRYLLRPPNDHTYKNESGELNESKSHELNEIYESNES